MVILILLLPDEPGTAMFPRVIVAQPVTDVGVMDGVEVNVVVDVNVVVGVKVGVLVNVFVGRGVLVGAGVLLESGAAVTGFDVLVGIGVLDGAVVTVGVSDGAVAVGLLDETVAVGALDEAAPIATFPRIVRALDEVKVREPRGMSLTRGLYEALTVTNTRS